MKTKVVKALLISGFFLFVINAGKTTAQDSLSVRSQTLDLKLQLLDSKLDLLDTKIKLWEAKPKELDIKLNEINSRMNSLDFDPKVIITKINRMDSMLKLEHQTVRSVEVVPQVVAKTEPEFVPVYNSAVMLDPARLFEGTFSLSYERILNTRYSVSIEGMATYSTKQGLSNYYFKNQSFALYDNSTNQYETFEGSVLYGGGINVQLRNYLLASHPNRRTAPLGLYAAPQVMYRNITISGTHHVFEETDPGVNQLVEKKVVQHLNIFAGGVILGYKMPLFKVLMIDVFAGGNIRLSKYRNESGFTKYKDWFNIDFSGISPVAGIAVGILK